VETVTADKLAEGMILARDVYVSEFDNYPLVTRNVALTDAVIHNIVTHGIQTVYIKDKQEMEADRAREAAERREAEQAAAGQAGASAFLDILAKSRPVLSPKQQERALDSLEDFYSMPSMTEAEVRAAAPQAFRQIEKVVSGLMDSLLIYKGTLVNINNLKSHDEFTYHHSLSVSVLSIAIAQQMGLDKESLRLLGMCSMMHDVGKMTIPPHILHKLTPLSDEEFQIMKGHALAGYNYLRQNQIGDEEMWRVILFHHEKMDGSGYPTGISEAQIPLLSRIISVADVYDALTSDRPQRKPMSPSEAVEYIMGGAGSAFDYDVVTAFVKKMDLYPVGSQVELSNHERAVVLDNANSMRPIVRLISSGQSLDLFQDRNCRNMVIDRVLYDAVAELA
jgi:putative nucleotidyltransferase with HDIG domain